MNNYRIVNRGEVVEVVLYGDIGAGWFGGITAMQVKDSLAGLSPDTIEARINTAGGDVDEGIAIANLFRDSDADVVAYVDSLAASIGSYIAVHGADEVVMASNARMMIHNAWTVAGGDANEFRKVADILDLHNDILIDAYVEKSGRSHDEIAQMMNEETWMNAEQAVEQGFADSVGESSLKAAAWFQPERFRNTPPDLNIDDPHPETAPAWKAEAARRRLRLTKSGG